MNEPAFIDIAPTDPRHRKIITTAIKANDQHALMALQGKTDKSIHFVTSWFYYALTFGDNPTDAVVIWSPHTRLEYLRFSLQLEGDEVRDPVSVNTYDFLI